MEQKKIVRKVSIEIGHTVTQFEFGMQDVVAIYEVPNGVKIYFRGEDEKINTATPRKMEDRPMMYYHGYPFIITDTLQ